MTQIIPAILPSSYRAIEAGVEKVHTILDTVQIDFVDGTFAPNRTWLFNNKDSDRMSEILSEDAGLPYWDSMNYELDLMVASPLEHMDTFVALGPSKIIFHIEGLDTEEMLAYFIRNAEKLSPKFFRPRVVIGVPSGITNVEMRAVYDAAIDAGAREVYLVEEAMAAAIGVRLPVLAPTATFIVDIGGGTTDIALIALGGMVRSLNLRVAGDHLNARVMEYLRDEFKLLVGEPTSEDVKLGLGSAIETDYSELEVRGRDLTTGLPRALMVTDGDIREALARPVSLLVAGIREVLETAPPEMVSEVLKNGIILTGGGALLHGLSKLVEDELKLPVFIAEDPLSAVARGTGIILENFEMYKGVLLSIDDNVSI